MSETHSDPREVHVFARKPGYGEEENEWAKTFLLALPMRISCMVESCTTHACQQMGEAEFPSSAAVSSDWAWFGCVLPVENSHLAPKHSVPQSGIAGSASFPRQQCGWLSVLHGGGLGDAAQLQPPPQLLGFWLWSPGTRCHSFLDKCERQQCWGGWWGVVNNSNGRRGLFQSGLVQSSSSLPVTLQTMLLLLWLMLVTLQPPPHVFGTVASAGRCPLSLPPLPAVGWAHRRPSFSVPGESRQPPAPRM